MSELSSPQALRILLSSSSSAKVARREVKTGAGVVEADPKEFENVMLFREVVDGRRKARGGARRFSPNRWRPSPPSPSRPSGSFFEALLLSKQNSWSALYAFSCSTMTSSVSSSPFSSSTPLELATELPSSTSQDFPSSTTCRRDRNQDPARPK